MLLEFSYPERLETGNEYQGKVSGSLSADAVQCTNDATKEWGR